MPWKSKKNQLFSCLTLVLVWATLVQAEEPAESWKDRPVQSLVTALDASLDYPPGVYSGKITIIDEKGRPNMQDFQMHVSEKGRFLELTSPARGVTLRILYLRQGEDIWVWDARRRDLLQLRGADQYNAIIRSGLSFKDLSGSSLEANFHPATAAREVKIEGGGKAINYSLIPMLPSSYGRISVIQEPGSLRVMRLDVYDRNTVLFKTIEISYDIPVLHLGKKKDIVPAWPVRMEALDLETGTITRLEVYTFDDTLEISDSLFRPDFLNR
ncbi:MAG: outer membrane lipoprotein-sorting protein [Leptospiraceae bacterium]